MTQLHRLAPKDFRLVASWTPSHGRQTRPAGTLPLVYWPDGHWCIEVNLFLQNLLSKGYAHESRGGTLGTYATYLAPLVRYCFKQKKEGKKSFYALSDGDFTKCVQAEYKKVRVREGVVSRANSRTTVRAIACVWLEFLRFIGDLYADELFVHADGVIRAERVLHLSGEAERTYWGTTWRHASIGPPDPYNRRMPLSEAQLVGLRRATTEISRKGFVRLRRLVMLALFDEVGLRRREASLLRVQDVASAIAAWKEFVPADGDAGPYAFFISFRMVKQKDGSKERMRKVPISAVTLQFFDEYLERRRRIMRKLGFHLLKPDAPFFANMRTGEPLEANFFTHEFFLLARACGISGPCSPHMARARFITREFVRLVRAHEMESLDDFRRALLNSNAFKERVRQITGHANAASLEVYINLALEEVAQLAETVRRVDAQRYLDALAVANERYLASIAMGDDPVGAGAALSRAVAASCARA